MHRGSLLATLAISVSSAVFCGTQPSFGQNTHWSEYYGYGGAAPAHGYGGGYHSSTAAEGYARGMSDVIRAHGDNNLANARAQRQWEAARKEYIDNRLLATQAYYDRRELYRQHQAEEHYEAREELAERLDQIRLADLSPQEFARESGGIQWPTLLANERFADIRSQLAQLFAKRAQYGELDVQDHSNAELLIREWRAKLTANRELFPETMLRDSLRFLLRLNRELEHNFG